MHGKFEAHARIQRKSVVKGRGDAQLVRGGARPAGPLSWTTGAVKAQRQNAKREREGCEEPRGPHLEDIQDECAASN